MNLHENREVLAEAVRLTAAKFNLPQSYVEKDYYLTLALLKLSQSEFRENVVFKGGTSLSKIYKAIYRFSEDIDLAVLAPSNSKIRKVLKGCIGVASEGLELVESEQRSRPGSKFRQQRYKFPRVNSSEALGEVQDSILFECNAYTTPSPAAFKNVRSLIAEWANKVDQQALIDDYNLHDFQILVLCWKRTYCEKILGLMAAASREQLEDKVRHFYDITVLLRQSEIEEFVLSDDEFYQMMSITIQNDINHAGKADLTWIKDDMSDNEPFSDFEKAWDIVKAAYTGDFQQMITRSEKNPSEEEIAKVFKILHERLASYSKTTLHQNCISPSVETASLEVESSPEPLSKEDIVKIEAILAERDQARANKDWETSDRLREELEAQGIVVEDNPDGTVWRRNN